ncbi:MAG: L,D-transpeptidase family protein, partial [Mucilaginibacter sp.]
IYLHDTPEQQFFAKDQRAFSHGCIRVQNAEKLAAMLLKNDGNAKDIPAVHYDVVHSKKHSFILNKRVPIMITYVTCEMKEGVLVKYDDIYNLDKSLELAFNYEIAATR